MKISQRYSAWLIVVFVIGLGAQATLNVRLELSLYDQAGASEVRATGMVLQDAIVHASRLQGDDAVLRLLRNAGERMPDSHFDWLWVDGRQEESSTVKLPSEALPLLADGKPVARQEKRPTAYVFSYYAPAVRGDRPGAVAVTRFDTHRAKFLRNLVLAQSVSALAGVVIAFLFSLLTVVRLRGVLREFIERVRTMGTPRSPRPLVGYENDHIGQLNRELDSLGGRYAEAQERQLVEERRRMADLIELQNANRLVTVGKLSAGMAHELGTPLGVALARAQMIAEHDPGNEETQKNVSEIIRQIQRMTTMCKEVLEYARPKASVMVPLDLVVTAKRMLSLLAPEARKRDVRLTLAPAPSVIVQGDSSKIMQILTNLIINAAQAMEKGGEVELAIDTQRVLPPATVGIAEGDYVCLHVRDKGSGISQENLPRIFDTFFTTRKEGEGTGLGLAVSYRLAREHGGWIGVESKRNEGSCFTLYLPATGKTETQI